MEGIEEKGKLQMKKVLILSCNTGQGHNSCAEAVKEYLEKKHIACEIQDTLAFISKKFSRFMHDGHNFMYRYLPGVFRWGYRYSEEHPAVFGDNSGIYKMLTSGVEPMYQYIRENEIDTVICTHVFSAMILTKMLKEHPMDISTSFVATDYTCSPSLDNSRLQHYFIPDEMLTEEFTKCGIPKEKIVASGIPVRQAFLKHMEKEDAKRLLGLPVNHRHLLVMCGSMGCNRIEKTVECVAESISSDVEVSVICGTNKKLQRILNWKYGKCENIHIIGYTNEVSLYMDAADLYITKPGGISVTEAAVKGVPMALVDAVAGCEAYNMEYFTSCGAAITADNAKELAKKSISMLSSEKERSSVEKAVHSCHFGEASRCIYTKLAQEQ